MRAPDAIAAIRAELLIYSSGPRTASRGAEAIQAILAAAYDPEAAQPGGVLGEIADERARQDEKWGDQRHAHGTGPRAVVFPFRLEGDEPAGLLADLARSECQSRGTAEKPDTWAAILLEEVFEALAEDDPQALRTELVQVAAVASQWVEAIDRRTDA